MKMTVEIELTLDQFICLYSREDVNLRTLKEKWAAAQREIGKLVICNAQEEVLSKGVQFTTHTVR